jgi:two-component system cell cycle sensor histidine kinase/response regulator CckA
MSSRQVDERVPLGFGRQLQGLPYLGGVALVAILYFGSAKIGLLAAVAYHVVSSAWPPAGVALVALLLMGVRYWPGIAIGAFLVNATSGVPLLGAAGIAMGNSLEAIVGTLLLHRIAGFNPALNRVKDVWALVFLAALLSTAVSATIGVGSLWLTGAIAADSLRSLWFVWWTGDATGVLVVAPVLLTWIVAPEPPHSLVRAVEAVALLVLLAVLTCILFSNTFSFVFAIFPLASWVALRLGARGGATATLLVSCLAVWFTMGGMGPFVASTRTGNLALLQIFMALLAITTSVISALMIERKTAGQALTQSEANHRLLFETIPTPLWVYDGETSAFLTVNEAAVQRYGYSREEFLGMTLKDIRPPEDIPPLRDQSAPSAEGFSDAEAWRHRKKDGTVIDVEISRHPLLFAGRPAVLAVAHDVTRSKSLESQLIQAQKMEAIGRLAGGIAHDFNNLLTAIFGSADFLLLDTGADDPRREDVLEIKKAAERAAGLTRQLLAFSRKQVMATQVLDLNGVVAGVEQMLRRLIGEDISFRTLLAPDLGAVRADPGQLEQVIMNLAVNARDAMPRGGKLTIETLNKDLDEAYAQEHVPVATGRYVMLAVSDTGVGMDDRVKAHLFEPFFTTKEKGKGTGLGLAMVYGIVKQSGGYIWAYSEPGRGTTFKIYLPRVQAPADPVTPRSMLPVSLKGSETVLVVEDEVAVRNVIRRVLETNGYVVLVASDGQEALRLANEHRGPIRLLLTDVVMPGMSGRELADRLALVRQEAKVLYLSGYTDDAIVQHGVLESGIAFLQKPFTPQGLARRLREVLDSG